MTVIDCPGNDGTKPILRLRAQEMAKEDLDVSFIRLSGSGSVEIRYGSEVAEHGVVHLVLVFVVG